MKEASESPLPTASEIVARASETAFGKPLVTNVLRGYLVEAMVEAALSPEWRLCSRDYDSWDFERADGIRLEVKQSAARQSWSKRGDVPTRCSFDIAPRQYAWVGGVRTATGARAAHVYVFAHHPITDETANHRDPGQWLFHVVRTDALPAGKRISLSALRAKHVPCNLSELEATVAGVS